MFPSVGRSMIGHLNIPRLQSSNSRSASTDIFKGIGNSFKFSKVTPKFLSFAVILRVLVYINCPELSGLIVSDSCVLSILVLGSIENLKFNLNELSPWCFRNESIVTVTSNSEN